MRQDLLHCEHTRTASMARTDYYPACFSHLRAQEADGSRVVACSSFRRLDESCGERGMIRKELPDKDSNLEPSG